LWTRKEAFVKGVGLGLSRPLDSFTVGLGIPVHLDAPGDTAWSLHHLDPGESFVGAVACSHPMPVLYGWRLDLAGG
jgi:4'-phosphopantetheinyl transferase